LRDFFVVPKPLFGPLLEHVVEVALLIGRDGARTVEPAARISSLGDVMEIQTVGFPENEAVAVEGD
jgi:hypothetical protein